VVRRQRKMNSNKRRVEMRDAKEWAGSISDEMLCDEGGGLYFDKVEALIREAQEDGARAERENLVAKIQSLNERVKTLRERICIAREVLVGDKVLADFMERP
jgi:hypothetical protein